MKVFFQTLLPKSGRAAPPDARPGAEEKAGANLQKPGASGKLALPARGGDGADGGRPQLVLEAGDFIDRIPHHLLRLGDFDLHWPLQFDMAEISDRIARGTFTIPLSDLLKAMPEMFVDDAQALHAMEIRFPWQRVMQMVKESSAAQNGAGGETLAQKLRRLRTVRKPAAPGAVQDAPVKTKREANSQFKRGAGRDGETAWFSKRSAATPEIPEAPESAPALFELPESTGTSVPPEAPPRPCPAPVEPAAALPAPDREPIYDLMDLSTAPLRLANPEKAGTGSEPSDPPPSGAANPAKTGPGETEQKMYKARIAFLEAQLKTLSSKHQNEVAIFKTEADRLVEKARTETEKERLDLMAQFQFERQRLAVAKDEQLARMEAEYRAVVAAQQNQISQLRTAREKASDEEQRNSVADFEKRLTELRSLEARIEPLSAELEAVTSERDRLAGLLLAEEERSAELESRLEFDLFALRVESAQIVAEERSTADEKIAALESRLAQEPAGPPNELNRETLALDHERALAARDVEIAKLRKDCADREIALDAAKEALARLEAERERAAAEQAEVSRRWLAAAREEAERSLLGARADLERERQQVIAERQQLLREMTVRAATSAVHKDEALAPLQAELEQAQALAAAQAAAHERVAAQWEEDIQSYRKRLQLIIGEKTALAAKLRAAEIALEASGRPVVATAA